MPSTPYSPNYKASKLGQILETAGMKILDFVNWMIGNRSWLSLKIAVGRYGGGRC
jgi:hypothetical protein